MRVKKEQTDHKLAVVTVGYCSGGIKKKKITTFTILWGPPKLFNKTGPHIQTKLSSGCYHIVFFYRHFSAACGTCLWRWNRQGVPKRWHIKFRRRGITQKKTYYIQNTAKSRILYGEETARHIRLFEKLRINISSTCLWRRNRQGVPKRWHIKLRRWGITQKKTYYIQNTAKVWNQEQYILPSALILPKYSRG